MGEQKPRNPVMLSGLMEKAEQDPMLRARLLTEPEKVASEHNVSLEPQEIQYLTKVGDLFRLVEELKTIHFGPGPIKYPAEKWMAAKLVSRIRTLPNLYPIGYYFNLARSLELQRAETFRAQTTGMK